MRQDWEVQPLGDVLRLEYGKPLDPSDRSPQGKYPVYGANGVKARTNKYLVDQVSLVVGRKGSAGEVTLSEERFWPLDVTYYAEFDRSSHNVRYLYYLLRHLNLPSLATGVKPGINRNVVYSLEVPVPPLAEQVRIVSILDSALAEIAHVTQGCSLNLERVGWLSDSVLAHLLLDSEMGDLAALGSVCVTAAGGTPLKSNKQNYAGGTVPWILSGEVNQPEITKATNFISDLGLANSSAKVFPPETVLVAMYGATAGKVSILRFAASTNQAVCGILPNDQYIPEFLVWYLRSKSHEIIAQAQGNAQPNLSQAKIRQTLIPVLPIEDQQAVVASVESVLATVSDYRRLAERKLDLLGELRASLTNHAITGQL